MKMWLIGYIWRQGQIFMVKNLLKIIAIDARLIQ